MLHCMKSTNVNVIRRTNIVTSSRYLLQTWFLTIKPIDLCRYVVKFDAKFYHYLNLKCAIERLLSPFSQVQQTKSKLHCQQVDLICSGIVKAWQHHWSSTQTRGLFKSPEKKVITVSNFLSTTILPREPVLIKCNIRRKLIFGAVAYDANWSETTPGYNLSRFTKMD